MEFNSALQLKSDKSHVRIGIYRLLLFMATITDFLVTHTLPSIHTIQHTSTQHNTHPHNTTHIHTMQHTSTQHNKHPHDTTHIHPIQHTCKHKNTYQPNRKQTHIKTGIKNPKYTKKYMRNIYKTPHKQKPAKNQANHRSH